MRRHATFNPPAWYATAPCASIGGDAWFPEPNEQAHAAKRVCGGCPYKAPCLLGAIERGEEHGIWGGQAARQFGRIRRELAAAAGVAA